MRYAHILTLILTLNLTVLAAVQSEQWWELETKMEKGGGLRIDGNDWWARAQALEAGESFTLTSKHPGGGAMTVSKQDRKRAKGEQMIVWTLDDDGDMDDSKKGDGDSDCYVVDYGCDGTVDRMVDYIDSDGDQIPNEMDIRYFVEGELRRSWMGLDLDGDGEMWDLEDYEYTGNFFASDPYDDNMIYMNKFNPNTHKWMPISECPFAFFDTDDDGASDTVARYSAAPLDFSEHDDPDFANSQKRYQGPHYAALENIGVMNIRYSFDIDGQASPDRPLHYEMGFNMIGALPYEFADMERTQPLRRAPKTTVCAPYDKVRDIAETYHADQTGFTWREFEDAAMRIGYPPKESYDRRWEGVFWTWRRRIMQNTGGPVQDWNVRREFCPIPTDKREVYYSPVDRRIHLKGATEGWLQVGHLFGDERLGEIRMFDTDGDGYFDRWEVWSEDSSLPLRVSSVMDAENEDFGNDWEAVKKFYTETVLPEATERNNELIDLFAAILDNSDEEEIEAVRAKLDTDISPDEKRYLLDLIREFYYILFVRESRTREKNELGSLPDQDPRSAPNIMRDSTKTWDRAGLLSNIDAAYAKGDYETVATMLKENRDRLKE